MPSRASRRSWRALPGARCVMAVICVTVLASCEGQGLPWLPTAPSVLERGIVVYEHANYLGESAHITSDIADLKHFNGGCKFEDSESGEYFSWDDCISSVRVAPGWRATLYEDDDFRDEVLIVTEDNPDLTLMRGCTSHGFNDCVTSIRIYGPR